MRKIVIFLIAILCSLVIIGAVASEENVSDEVVSQEESEVVEAPEDTGTGSEIIASSDSDILKDVPKENVSISITKYWNDAENNSTRPNGIEIMLYANGKQVDSIYLTEEHAISDGVWAYTFDNVPKYDADGNVISYTVKEQEMAFYTTDIMQNSNYEFMIINTFSMPRPEPVPDDPTDDGAPSGDAEDDGSGNAADNNSADKDNNTNVTKTITKNPKKVSTTQTPVNHNNTGNPIFVLVLVLISSVFISIRRKD